MPHRDSVLAQQRRRTDAGQLQELRRTDGARRENHFTLGLGILLFIAVPELETDRALAVEAQDLGMGICEDVQVWPRHRGAQKRLRGRPAPAIADRALEITDALVVPGIVVVCFRDTVVDRGALPGLDDLPALAIILHA